MATWPPSLPAHTEIEGYEETPPELAIRSPMDAGPAKTRRRFSAGPTAWTGALLLTPDQVTTLLDFWRETVAGGSLRFEWQHPRTGAAVEMRFARQPRPQHRAEGLWRVALEMEIL